MTEGVPQSYSITLFHLLPLPFPGGPGGFPLVISLSPLASIYKTSKQIFTPHLSLSPFVSLPGGVPQSYSITLLLTAITIPWGVQGVSPWLILSSSCFNLHNHNTDINTAPFVPFPLSIPPWGVSPQSYSIFFFFTYYHYYSLVQGVWVQGVSPWLIISSSCFNLYNHNTDINTPFVPFP